MTKEEIVAVVAAQSGISKVQSEAVIDAFLDTISDALELGEEVRLGGFGSFCAKRMAPRVGLNPHTKEKVPIPERIRPVFKPGKQLLKRF